MRAEIQGLTESWKKRQRKESARTFKKDRYDHNNHELWREAQGSVAASRVHGGREVEGGRVTYDKIILD